MLLPSLVYAADLDVAALAATADPARVEATIAILSGEAALPDGTVLTSRAMRHPDHDRARDWLAHDAWTGVERVAVEVQDAEGGGFELANVVGELPGADPTLPPLLLAAHWDSTAVATEGWVERTDPAPGADDDASGVAAVIEAARVLGSWEPGFQRTIRFVLFDGEERGLLGSTAYVDGLVASGEPLELALCLDPVGYNPDDASIFWISYDSAGGDAAAAMVATGEDVDAGLEVYAADAAAWGGDTRSDHAPFQAAGLVALHGGSFPQPDAYHTVGDTLSVVDVGFTTGVSQLAIAHFAALAEPLAAEEPAPATGCDTGGAGVVGGVGLLLGLGVLRRLPRRLGLPSDPCGREVHAPHRL
jgi:leucyl aminopeptidase